MFERHNNMEYQNTIVTNNKTYYPRQIGRPNPKTMPLNVTTLIDKRIFIRRIFVYNVRITGSFFVINF